MIKTDGPIDFIQDYDFLAAYKVEKNLRIKIKLSNANFKDCKHIVDSCYEAWNTLCDTHGNIKNLCTKS